jgi:hypothetical protein
MGPLGEVLRQAAAQGQQISNGQKLGGARRLDVQHGRPREIPKTYSLWPGYLDKGHLTLFSGQKRSGKTLVLMYAAAVVSRGGDWHNGAGKAKQGHVFILASEDDYATRIVPRLIPHNANFHFIHYIKGTLNEKNEPDSFNLQKDLDALRAEMDRLIAKGESVELIIIHSAPTWARPRATIPTRCEP